MEVPDTCRNHKYCIFQFEVLYHWTSLRVGLICASREHQIYMHLQSTYEPSLLLKFNSTTLHTWWCTWEVMYKHTFFPSPCCSDPHRTVLQWGLYLQRTLRMCKMITRSLRRTASRYGFRNSLPYQQWKKNDIRSSVIPCLQFLALCTNRRKKVILTTWSVAQTSHIFKPVVCSQVIYRMAEKFGRELDFTDWELNKPAAKLNSAKFLAKISNRFPKHLSTFAAVPTKVPFLTEMLLPDLVSMCCYPHTALSVVNFISNDFTLAAVQLTD